MAAQYAVPTSILSDWKKAFCDGEIKTESQKPLERNYQKLQKTRDCIAGAW
ncbi:MAG: hypothetical protein WCQ67_03125 [Treponema sp.]